MQTIDRQIAGAVIVVLLINIACLARGLFPEAGTSAGDARYAEQKQGYRTVELTGEPRSAGIYFVPPGTSLAEFLKTTGVGKAEGFSKKDLARKIETGEVIRLNRDGGTGGVVSRGALGSSKRFVLDLPININRAGANDLMLVPGIGEKTAEAVLQTRKELGGFKQMEDLLQVRGIGPKRLETFRKYFCLNDRAPSKDRGRGDR